MYYNEGPAESQNNALHDVPSVENQRTTVRSRNRWCLQFFGNFADVGWADKNGPWLNSCWTAETGKTSRCYVEASKVLPEIEKHPLQPSMRRYQELFIERYRILDRSRHYQNWRQPHRNFSNISQETDTRKRRKITRHQSAYLRKCTWPLVAHILRYRLPSRPCHERSRTWSRQSLEVHRTPCSAARTADRRRIQRCLSPDRNVSPFSASSLRTPNPGLKREHLNF